MRYEDGRLVGVTATRPSGEVLEYDIEVDEQGRLLSLRGGEPHESPIEAEYFGDSASFRQGSDTMAVHLANGRIVGADLAGGSLAVSYEDGRTEISGALTSVLSYDGPCGSANI